MPRSSLPETAELCRGDGGRVFKNIFYNVFSFKIYIIYIEDKKCVGCPRKACSVIIS